VVAPEFCFAVATQNPVNQTLDTDCLLEYLADYVGFLPIADIGDPQMNG
jgi:hypothetical protein